MFRGKNVNVKFVLICFPTGKMWYDSDEVSAVTVGERIKMLRTEKHMTLEDVAKGIGTSRATVFKYENGTITNIPLDKIEAIAKLFGVASSYLTGWTDSRNINDGEMFGVVVPDNDTFVKLYEYMTYQERVTMMEIFNLAYARMQTDSGSKE